MTTKYGDFVAPVFHTIGDPYKDGNTKAARDKGLGFIATVGRRGKNNDACFDKAKILFEGERYLDPSRLARAVAERAEETHMQRLLAKAEKNKSVADAPFKGPSPMKLSVGLGDFHGTFQGKVPYIAGSPEVSLKKGDTQEGKPNLYTAPGKKGSYGFIKTTISEHKGAGGAVGEYRYTADPYSRAKELEAAIKAKAKNVVDTPFVPSNPARKGGPGFNKTTIGNKAHGVAGEYEYRPCGPDDSPGPGTKAEGAFVPPRAPRKGYNCTFSKYPTYAADPEHLKVEARKHARQTEKQMMPANAWNPPHIPKAGATRSIVRMNV